MWNAEHVPNLCSANSAPGGNNAEYFAPRQLTVDNGLTISAEPWTLVEGYSYVSGCISSFGHFALKSGIVRVRARMPDTTLGAWPAIWFLPGPTRVEDNDVGEVDVHEGGMLGRVSGVPINQVVASTFHRPDLDGYQLGFGYNAGVALNSSFHDFDLELSVGMVRALFDDVPVATWTKNLTGDPVQIIIGLSVASEVQPKSGTRPGRRRCRACSRWPAWPLGEWPRDITDSSSPHLGRQPVVLTCEGAGDRLFPSGVTFGGT